MLQINGINVKLIRVSATTTPQALVEEIQEFWKMYNFPVFIELPNQPLQHIEAFYRPDSFHVLNRLRREYNTPILFVIPAGVRMMNEARRAGFPVYSSLSEGVEIFSREGSPTLNASNASSSPLSPPYNRRNSQSGLVPPSSGNSQSGLIPPPPPRSPASSSQPLGSAPVLNGPIPAYMSNPPSWSSWPMENMVADSKRVPNTTPPSFPQYQFDRQPQVESATPIPRGVEHPYADEGMHATSTPSIKELGSTSQPTFVSKQLDSRPIYRRPAYLVTFAVLIFLLLLGGVLISLNRVGAKGKNITDISSTSGSAPVVAAHGIGVEKAPDGEYIGLSDGTFAFDTDRADGTTKQQGATKLRGGDVGTALSLWHEALARDTNDAEALIYLEDQRVVSSGSPYVTLVVGTMDTGTYISLGRDDLQGAYVAQKEYNDQQKLPGKYQVRLLIASTGNDKEYANIVAQQIVEAAKNDPTIVGVMGWPYSSRTLNVVKTLTNAHLPIVSQMASSILLTGISPYFFRIVPPDSTQAKTGAIFTENVLHAKAAALFVDPSDAYSVSIGNAFAQKFTSDGNTLVATEHYTVGKPSTVTAALKDALLHGPDVIYFAGLADDANALLASLPTQGRYAQIKVVGGDGLYSTGSYSKEAVVQQNFHRLCFSAFAYADTWGYLADVKQQPSFFSDYPAFFDPYQQHTGGTYGYDRAESDVILSYDATDVLLTAYNNVLTAKQGFTAATSVTPVELRDALASITGAKGIQGATGQIAFGPDNDPVGKVVVMLAISPKGLVQLQSVQGKFFK